MFTRRRGSSLQVVRAFRDENGKPCNEAFGTVSIFDKKIKPEVAERLSREDQKLLRAEMKREAAACVAESREILESLAALVSEITDGQLMDGKIYGALGKLSGLCAN